MIGGSRGAGGEPPSAGGLADQLVRSGRVARLVTRGRRSGREVPAAVGFVATGDGCLLVAAGSPAAAWARNLLADPAATVTVGDRSWAVTAEPLEGAAHAAAVRELILRYGTPSEGLGAGPSFCLRPVPRGRPAGPPGGQRARPGGPDR